jgi:hypothetical protein
LTIRGATLTFKEANLTVEKYNLTIEVSYSDDGKGAYLFLLAELSHCTASCPAITHSSSSGVTS